MESRDKDQFDDLLDRALRRYGDVEPRAGLEGRVLASVAANGGRAGVRGAWGWALAGASVLALLLVVWIGIGHRRSSRAVVSVRPSASEESAQKTAAVRKPVELQKAATKRARAQRIPLHVTLAKAAEPRLQQFPSARPISEEETMLVQYVQRYPGEAMLIAQRQNELEEQVRQAEREIEENSSSDQQER